MKKLREMILHDERAVLGRKITTSGFEECGARNIGRTLRLRGPKALLQVRLAVLVTIEPRPESSLFSSH